MLLSWKIQGFNWTCQVYINFSFIDFLLKLEHINLGLDWKMFVSNSDFLRFVCFVCLIATKCDIGTMKNHFDERWFLGNLTNLLILFNYQIKKTKLINSCNGFQMIGSQCQTFLIGPYSYQLLEKHPTVTEKTFVRDSLFSIDPFKL